MKDLRLKAEKLGVVAAANPTILLVGSGEAAYLWIGSDAGPGGIAKNTPETRGFLRRALQRMESGCPTTQRHRDTEKKAGKGR